MKSHLEPKRRTYVYAAFGMLIAVWALVFSACEDVTNSNGGIAGISELTALSVSSAKVGQPTPIYTDSDLADIGFGLPSNGDYILADNLTLTDWIPICGTVAGSLPFTGTFDGAGYTITVNNFDISVTSGTDSIGIFAETDEKATTYDPAAISNLTVNIAAPANKYRNTNFGVLVGNATNVALNNITVTGLLDADIVDDDQNVGGVAGMAQSAQFNNVNVTANFDVRFQHSQNDAAFNFGGVAGYPQTSSFTGNTVKSNIKVTAAPGGTNTITVNTGGVAGYAKTSQFTGSTVTLTPFTVNATGAGFVNQGGVAGLADSATFSRINVSGTYNGTINVPASTQKGKLALVGGEYRVLGLTAAGSDGLNIGGVAGGVNASQFSTTGQGKPSQLEAVISDVTINATNTSVNATTSAPVYLGGVVGYANGANIDNAQVSGSITGQGDGYNTSAGGVAGYIIASRVRDSSASTNVTLKAVSQTLTVYNSWQIYAGGLVGYVGGSDYAPSLVDHSHAAGTVYANSPFPYAGGLVGYLYGYNDFSNPAKNGSTVKRSYAAGGVTAAAQTGSGDIPYAGGLVGYASVVDSTIEDSYATGAASATTGGTYAWAGGIIGGNANNAVVIRTYATGNVTSTTGILPPLYSPDYAPAGPAAGGIAGFNYYTANTSISKSVALNNLVHGNQSTTQDVIHRVAGSLGDGTGHDGVLNSNYANKAMNVTDNWKSDPFSAVSRDGADTDTVPPQALYEETLKWDLDNVWEMSGSYPTLR